MQTGLGQQVLSCDIFRIKVIGLGITRGDNRRCTITRANQVKGGLGRQWKTHCKVKLPGLKAPAQNPK